MDARFFNILFRSTRWIGAWVTKDEVFSFVYGLLHSPEYREKFAGELKQWLPRIPHIPTESFAAFVGVGEELFRLHADFGVAEQYSLEVVGGESPPMDGEEAYYRVQKLRFRSGEKATDAPATLIVNENITVRGISEEAYRYQFGSRSVIEWVMRQYQVNADKTSGIVNDPNQWGKEHGNRHYLLDLVEKVVTISVRTMTITEGLPAVGAENGE